MAKYKCTESPSAKVWKDGVGIGGQVDEVKFGATVTAEKQGTALYITAGANRGKQGWSKLGWFELLPDAPPPPPPPPPPSGSSKLYQMLRVRQSGDPDPLGTANSKGVGTPDVIVLADGAGRVQFTKAWQMYLVASNPNMQPKHVAAIMGSGRWGFNRTGLPSERFPQKRANWIMNEDTEYPNPETDKVRTFTYCVHRGIRDGNEVVLETMNGNEPPPLGVTPATHPHLFCHLTIVYPEERTITPFPNGAPAWGYTSNFTFFPLVSTVQIRVPLSTVREVSEYRLPYKPPRA